MTPVFRTYFKTTPEHPVSEHLIDYLFGLLADDERAAFESLLTADRRLSTELDMLRRPLTWLAADVVPASPPTDLADRTRRHLTICFRGDIPPASM